MDSEPSDQKGVDCYLCIAAVAALLLSFATTQVCERWMDILVERNALDMDSMYASDGGHYVYYHEKGKLSAWEQTGMIFLQEISKWCPFVYTVITMLVFASFFYRKRLKKTVCHPGGGCGPDWQEGSGFYGLLCE